MKLIILDRDGVINFESPHYIKSVEEWRPIPGSLEAMARLCQMGYKIAIATNQSGLAKGLFDHHTLQAIHQKMQGLLSTLGGSIARIFVCPHNAQDNCDCRKPNTGLFKQIEAFFGISLKTLNPPCIGDSIRDLQAAEAMGAQPILVLTGHGQASLTRLPEFLKTVPRYENLAQAVDEILKSSEAAILPQPTI